MVTTNNRLAFAVFALVCCQATFLFPYVVIVRHERTNLFTTALCLLPAAVLLVGRNRRHFYRLGNWIAWLVLLGWLIVSALCSQTPTSSVYRALSFVVPGLSGLYCAGILFRDKGLLRAFLWLFTGLFSLFTGSHLLFGSSPSFLALHHHPLADAMLALSVGPMYFMLTDRTWKRFLFGVLLAAGYLVCFLAGSRFLVLLPLVLLPMLLLLNRFSIRWALRLLVVSLVPIVIFFRVFPDKVPRLVNYESTFYRVEGIPAALSIVKDHPLLGIGFATPRRPFLETFKPVFGLVSPEGYLSVVDRITTSDNLLLTLLVGCGIPMTVLYLWIVWDLLRRFARRIRERSIDPTLSKVVAFVLLGFAVHMTIYDGLFYPQVDWFFYALLGLAAGGGCGDIRRSGPASA